MLRTSFCRLKQIPRLAKYHVLAIETSCDDTTVALIDRPSPDSRPVLISHLKRSLDNTAAGGIIPLDARNFHQTNLAPLVHELLASNGVSPYTSGSSADNQKKIDIIAATRGPGMVGSLAAGYNLAKGLAVAWNVPLVGVNHMVGHLVTPRFFNTTPKYPFISLLVSGGHTMLVESKSITDHRILCSSVDIAIGDMLDKCGRELGVRGNMIGKELEAFINTGSSEGHGVPSDLKFPNPLQNKSGGRKNTLGYSFAGFITSLRVLAKKAFGTEDLASLPDPTRRELASRLQHAIFHHLRTKTVLGLKEASVPVKDVVCSGGVASNLTLRDMLETEIQSHFGDDVKFHYPEPKWCTDNALMIGWAGIELWESGYQTDLSAKPTAKWSVEDVLDIDGWIKN